MGEASSLLRRRTLREGMSQMDGGAEGMVDGRERCRRCRCRWRVGRLVGGMCEGNACVMGSQMCHRGMAWWLYICAPWIRPCIWTPRPKQSIPEPSIWTGRTA